MTDYDDYNPLINIDEYSMSVSVDNSYKKKRETNKKKRRSRITINDNTEPAEIKREYYDSETKLKKSIQSAVTFNRYINNERNRLSKHFLKRKVKAAFEREPIDKTKNTFNVLFYPSLAMFNPPSQPMPSQSVNNPNLQRPQISMTKPILTERPPEIKKNIPVFTSDSRINNSSTTENRTEPILMNNIGQQNVLAPHIIPQIQPQININPQIHVHSTISKPTSEQFISKEVNKEKMIEPNVIQIRLNEQTKPDEKKIVKSNLPENSQQRQNAIFKQLCEKYMSNPEKMKNELSPHDLQKLQMLIRKNLTQNSQQNSNMDQINLQILKNNLNGVPVSMNLGKSNNNPTNNITQQKNQPQKSNILTIPLNLDTDT